MRSTGRGARWQSAPTLCEKPFQPPALPESRAIEPGPGPHRGLERAECLERLHVGRQVRGTLVQQAQCLAKLRDFICPGRLFLQQARIVAPGLLPRRCFEFHHRGGQRASSAPRRRQRFAEGVPGRDGRPSADSERHGRGVIERMSTGVQMAVLIAFHHAGGRPMHVRCPQLSRVF
jgi:hypothetical protein